MCVVRGGGDDGVGGVDRRERLVGGVGGVDRRERVVGGVGAEDSVLRARLLLRRRLLLARELSVGECW